MTLDRKQRRSFLKYLNEVSRDFGLKDWEMFAHLEEAPPTEDAIAATTCIEKRKIAHILFSEAYFKATPEEQRHVLLHELLHIHLWEAHQFPDEALSDHLGSQGLDIFGTAFNGLMEHAVDAIAGAIADRYPLWEG